MSALEQMVGCPLRPGLELDVFAQDDLAAQRLAREVGFQLEQAVATRGRACLAVSGGKSPVRFFQHLAATALAWHLIDITLVDERWVPPEHSDSNERLVRQHLLKGPAAQATLMGLWCAGGLEGAGVQAHELAWRERFGRLDAVVLGMGEDGHTASWFPGAPELDLALDEHGQQLLVTVHPPQAPHARRTLSLRAVLEADKVWLAVQGESKLKVLSATLEEGIRSTAKWPVASVVHHPQRSLRMLVSA